MSEIDREQPMTPEEAAEWLRLDKFGYDVDLLRQWARENRIESIRIGHRLAFLRKHLVRFLDRGIPEETPARGKLKKVT